MKNKKFVTQAFRPDLKKIIIKQIILTLIICQILFLTTPCLVLASTFEQRRQDWLNRNGTDTDGGCDDRADSGMSFILAWLEKGLSKDPKGICKGTLSEHIQQNLSINNAAGKRAGLTVIRALLQYGDKLRLGDINDIHKTYRLKVQNMWGLPSRAVQIQRTVESYLYTSYFFPEAKFKFGYINNKPDPNYKDWIASCYGCSGTRYVVGKFHSSLEYTRDSLYARMELLTKIGNSELDGSYTSLLTDSLLLLYDYTQEPEMKRRAKMMLDFMMLEQAMEYSAGHKGGAFGRFYRNSMIKPKSRGLHAYPLLGLGPPLYESRHGHNYSTSYRVPELIYNLVHVEKEPKSYWHIHEENNNVGSAVVGRTTGKFVYVTPFYNMGGAKSYRPEWQLALEGGDEIFRIWINRDADSGDPTLAWNYPIRMGDYVLHQYKNALLQEGGYDHLHVVKGDNVFDYGEWNLKPIIPVISPEPLEPPESPESPKAYKNDYSLGSSSWKFFQEGKVMLAMKQGNCSWAIEVAIKGVEYPNLNDFMAAVNKNSELTCTSFTTSKRDTIYADNTVKLAGASSKQDIWDFPFDRMEAVYGYGDEQRGKLIDWDNNVMTVSKNNSTCTYNFNNWTFQGNDCEGMGGVSYLTDFNCDQEINIQDFGILLSYWGQEQELDNYQHPECWQTKNLDLVSNNIIDASDLGSLLSCWGTPESKRCHE